jgi:hypothetical protein
MALPVKASTSGAGLGRSNYELEGKADFGSAYSGGNVLSYLSPAPRKYDPERPAGNVPFDGRSLGNLRFAVR